MGWSRVFPIRMVQISVYLKAEPFEQRRSDPAHLFEVWKQVAAAGAPTMLY